MADWSWIVELFGAHIGTSNDVARVSQGLHSSCCSRVPYESMTPCAPTSLHHTYNLSVRQYTPAWVFQRWKLINVYDVAICSLSQIIDESSHPYHSLLFAASSSMTLTTTFPHVSLLPSACSALGTLSNPTKLSSLNAVPLNFP